MMAKFAESLDTAVFTTKYVLDNNSQIVYVHHYKEDGAWQFSGKEDCDDGDYRIISLEEIINIDSSILEIATMQLGYYAKRENKNTKWEIKKRNY